MAAGTVSSKDEYSAIHRNSLLPLRHLSLQSALGGSAPSSGSLINSLLTAVPSGPDDRLTARFELENRIRWTETDQSRSQNFRCSQNVFFFGVLTDGTAAGSFPRAHISACRPAAISS